MGCKICGRGSCCSSLHSIAEQEAHEKYSNMSERELIDECIDKSSEVCELNKRVEVLEKALDKLTDVASECDSWESFPQGALDDALSVL
jgi:hypothetical protein